MKELANHELDPRLQKQVSRAEEALKKGGADYAVQVCGEILKKYPSAWQVRSLFWKSLFRNRVAPLSGIGWLKTKVSGVLFRVSTWSLLKKNPLEVVIRCDEVLRRKQLFPELFGALGIAAELLEWPETRILACKGALRFEPEKTAPRIALAEVLAAMNRPNEAIEHLEWVLVREPTNGSAQRLIKNASVAETLQRGNWEDTGTTFHSKTKDAR